MWNYELGEDVPCPKCRQEDCNGFCKRPERTPATPSMSGSNEALKRFFGENAEEKIERAAEESNERMTFDQLYRQRMQTLGRKGGNKTAERGSDYFSRIAKGKRKYVEPERE